MEFVLPNCIWKFLYANFAESFLKSIFFVWKRPACFRPNFRFKRTRIWNLQIELLDYIWKDTSTRRHRCTFCGEGFSKLEWRGPWRACRRLLCRHDEPDVSEPKLWLRPDQPHSRLRLRGPFVRRLRTGQPVGTAEEEWWQWRGSRPWAGPLLVKGPTPSRHPPCSSVASIELRSSRSLAAPRRLTPIFGQWSTRGQKNVLPANDPHATARLSSGAFSASCNKKLLLSLLFMLILIFMLMVLHFFNDTY